MLVILPELLNAEQVHACREALEKATWVDGRTTAGQIARRVKVNQQLAPDDPIGRELGATILAALSRNGLFQAAAMPVDVLPPRFNRYENGGHYGFHIDNAFFRVEGGASGDTPVPAHNMRADLSTTIFLSEPDSYEGGELITQDAHGEHAVKLPAGHAALYPSTSLHRVAPVTRGTRYAAFFWSQSLVRDDAKRSVLFDLQSALQRLTETNADAQAIIRLSGTYQNLLRRWAGS